MVQIISSKRLQIDKANASMVIFLAAASFIVVFSLVASKALLDQRSYQSRVIEKKKRALNQLKANNQAANQLVNSYKSFVSAPDNIIAGNPSGTGDRDGDNAKIILDALPSKYDFPALVTSVEKLLSNKSNKINSISGTDDELNQSKEQTGVLQPIAIPVQAGSAGSFDTMLGLMDVLQRSIRPIKISSLNFSGNDKELSVSIIAKTYYQPEKKVNITSEVVK